MPLANVASEAAAVKRALNGGGTLLVVGGRSTNFDETVRTHPRVVIWDSTDPKTEGREPADNTKVIICTRFIRHAQFSKLQRFATKRHILMMPGLGGTGEIKDVIHMALDVATATPAAPPLTTSTIHQPSKLFTESSAEPDVDAHGKIKRGELKAFVAAHGDLDASPAKEARRLLPVAVKAGLLSTEGAITQTLYLLRRERAGLSSYKGGGSHHPTTKAAATAPAVAPASNVGEALRLIDDVSTGLSLLREAVLKVQQDEAQMQATMTALRGFLNPGAH